jgi:DNA ligase (NAD+)
MKELMAKIKRANNAYRDGNQIISDSEYDILLSKLEDSMNMIEFEAFKMSLMDGKGTTKLEYVVGSLEKVKFEEPEKLMKWVTTQKINKVFVSAKVDGVSFVAEYNNGVLLSCSSRGDGQEGTDWTEKGRLILPKTIKYSKKLDVRGEFTLTGDSYKQFDFKNRRGGTAGIMNSKDANDPRIASVKAIAYEIMNGDLTIQDQFQNLIKLGFTTPPYIVIPVTDNLADDLKLTFEHSKAIVKYDIDGIVLSSPLHVRENVYYPKGKIAFKVNSEGVPTVVTGYTLNVTKNRFITITLQVKPTEVSGVTISNVTGNNTFGEEGIVKKGIGIGSEILIIRSGEVIPKCVGVTKSCPVVLPTHCPICGTSLVQDGVNLRCQNMDCGTATVKRVEAFIKELDIENVSESRLVEWNINNFQDLINFKADNSYKTQVEFCSELQKKMFSAAPEKLMRSFSIEGVGTSTFDKLYEEFGNLRSLNSLFNDPTLPYKLPKGVGLKTIFKGQDDWKEAWNVLALICANPSYKMPAKVAPKTVTAGKLTGKSFLITGTMSVPRKEIEDKIVANGGTIASAVKKDLSFLVCGDKAGSKLDKATALNIKVITEDELNRMI